MPTGYTADVGSGKITSFSDYALQCARNFGACVMLRDEPMSSNIPEFQPSGHYAERLAGLKSEFDFIRKLPADEIAKRADADYESKMIHYRKSVADSNATKARYEAMLEKARQFRPPTPGHANYAEFIVKQLTESIEWDCCEAEPPIKPTAAVWFSKKTAQLEQQIEWYTKEQAEEIKRTNTRNKWIADLRTAIAAVNEPQPATA